MLAVVPIVMGIVLFKKAREKKRKVQYCRGGLLCPGVRERECVCACVRVCMCVHLYMYICGESHYVCPVFRERKRVCVYV